MTPRKLPIWGIRARSGIEWGGTNGRLSGKKCIHSSPCVIERRLGGEGPLPRNRFLPKGSCWQAGVRAQDLKAAGKGFPGVRPEAPTVVLKLAASDSTPSTLSKAAEPKTWLRRGQESPSKARDGAGKHFCSPESKCWTRSRKGRLRDSSGEGKEGAGREGRRCSEMGARSSPQGWRRGALHGRRKQGDNVGKGHTRRFSLDHVQQSRMAPNEKNMDSDFRGTNIKTPRPPNLRPSEDSGEGGFRLPHAALSQPGLRAGLPKDVRHLSRCTRGWPRGAGWGQGWGSVWPDRDEQTLRKHQPGANEPVGGAGGRGAHPRRQPPSARSGCSPRLQSSHLHVVLG